MTNLLKNGSFEGGQEPALVPHLVFPVINGVVQPSHTEQHENVVAPRGWCVWWLHDHRPDDEVAEGWDQPEAHLTQEARRVSDGAWAWELFTFSRRHTAGLFQIVEVPGHGPVSVWLRSSTRWPMRHNNVYWDKVALVLHDGLLTLSAACHAWSNENIPGPGNLANCPGDGTCSTGAGRAGVGLLASEDGGPTGDPWRDGLYNSTFDVGIDLAGGEDVRNVSWGYAWHIYNVPRLVSESLRISDTPPPPPPAPSTWNYPVVEEGTKLGIHTIRANNVPGFVRQALDAGACLPVVKAVDQLGTLHVVREMSPETITVGRVHYVGEALSEAQFTRDPLAVARELMAHTTAKVQLHGDDVDYWEPTNETLPPGPAGYERFAQIHFHMMDIAEREGYKIALFSCNAGTPEWDEMVAMVETGVFARAKQGGHILSLHEGVFGMDPIEKWWGGSIPGSPIVDGAGALCFRYRHLYHLLEQRGEVIPLVVSEIVFGGGYSQDGTTAAEVVRRARWYDERAREDYYFLGFCPFTLGPVGGWGAQDYEWAYPALVEYAIGIKDEPNALPGSAPPQPQPGPRGQPRKQYARTYLLLPPGAGVAWAQAVVDATWDSWRLTIGGSADDAGIGDLDNRRVIAVNPDRWPDDLKAFFARYYPGVEYVAIEAETPDDLVLKLGGM